jgi:glutamate-1-semialdehyde 2,1-aminomutase
MQVSGGCIPGTPDFLRGLRALATKHNALLIFDEIMTSRLDYGGLQVTYDITPDVTTIGKWAGGGMSFGAFGARREIMDWFDPAKGKLAHAGTFNNNVMTMAAGIAGSKIMGSEQLRQLNDRGAKLMGEIDAVLRKQLGFEGASVEKSEEETKMFVTGMGSLFAIRFRGEGNVELREIFYHYLLEEGIFIASRGLFALNIMITDEHCAKLVRVVEAFVGKYRTVLC